MPTSTDPGSSRRVGAGPSGVDPSGVDPLAKPRAFRRRTTLVFAWFFVAAPLVGGGLIGVQERHHGLNGMASAVGAIALAVVAFIMGVRPRVVLRAEGLEVHNSIFWFDVPYVSVSELKPTKLGLVIRTYAGKLVPIAAYASGSGKRVLGHEDAADELIRAVQERTAYVDDTKWKEAPPPTRHVERGNLTALAVSVAAAATVIAMAAA